MQIIDFHTHLFSRAFFDSIAEASPLAGAPQDKLARVAEQVGIELPEAGPDAHLARWTASLDAHGVERVAGFASAPEEIPTVLDMAERSGGRIVPIAVTNPAAAGAADRLRPLFEDRGLRGVLLFPALHHYHLTDTNVQPVLDLLEEHRAACYVHCGVLVVKIKDLLGLPRPYDLRYANPLEVIPAANDFPSVTFCIPHFGAGFFRETLLAGAQCPNVVTDTSSSNGWIRTQPAALELRDVFERALGVFGPERILFGTDSGTFPAGWRADRLAEWSALCDAVGLDADARQAFFAGNAARILDSGRTDR